jgi:hypothetical protein
MEGICEDFDKFFIICFLFGDNLSVAVSNQFSGIIWSWLCSLLLLMLIETNDEIMFAAKHFVGMLEVGNERSPELILHIEKL